MQTRKVDQLRADILRDAMERISAGAARVPDDCYSVRTKPGAMLVDPVNRDPFVYVAPDVVHEFESIPRSGTDKLRQRTRAAIFFDSL